MAGESQDDVRELWDWYKYHAQQRLTSFNFFMVFAGAVLVLLQQAVKAGDMNLIRVAGGLGASASLCFYLLDVRNARLVRIGGDAFADTIPLGSRERLHQVICTAREDEPKWGDVLLWQRSKDAKFGLGRHVIRHAFVLRLILLVAAVAFIAIAVVGKG